MRISNAIEQYTKNSTDVVLKTNQDSLKQAEKRLEELEKWLADREEAYWRRFTAMEAAISRLNSQTSWLQSQLGSL